LTIKESGSVNFTNLEKSDYSATVEIKRRSRPKPFFWTVYFVEVASRHKFTKVIDLNYFWKKQPRFQTKKCCVAQGFRFYFSETFGGVPHIQEEMGYDENIKNITADADAEIITEEQQQDEKKSTDQDSERLQFIRQAWEELKEKPEKSCSDYIKKLIGKRSVSGLTVDEFSLIKSAFNGLIDKEYAAGQK